MDQWASGRMEIKVRGNWIVVNPQLLTPDPPVVGERRFRKALMHATNREEMAATIMRGFVPVVHSWVSPAEPMYRQIEPSIVKYDYDVRRGTQLLEELGYTRGPDGTFRDARGDKLAIEMRTSAGNDNQTRAMIPVADYWQRFGMAVETVLVPPQRRSDLEYRATFPGFELQQNPNNASSIRNLLSSESPRAENNFTGGNKNRYMNSQFDQLIERYFTTIPTADRTAVMRQIVVFHTDNVLQLPIYAVGEAMLIGNRIKNVSAGKALAAGPAWNAEQWEVIGVKS